MEIPPQLPCNGCGCEIPLDLRGPRRKWCNDCNPKKAPTFVREERRSSLQCDWCGVAFSVKWSREARGQRCCSKSCAVRLRSAPAATRIFISDCSRCGSTMVGRRRRTVCDSCKAAVRPRPKPVKASRLRIIDCAECGRICCVHGAGLSTRRFCGERCADRAARRMRRQKERATGMRHKGRVRRDAVVETFTTREIAERDGWRCHICGKKVPDRPYKAKALDPTLDHLVPVSAGGDHTRANVALAHNRCNYERNTGGEVQLRLVG